MKADHTVVCWGGGPATPSGTFLQVHAAGYAACGLRTDHTLSCWGDGGVAALVPAGEFEQLSSGRQHACALDANGAATCWGDNSYGEITPTPGTYSLITVGDYYTCALRTDQQLACWGYYNHGLNTPPTGTFTDVDAGLEFACAVRTTGEIVCWGYTPDLAAAGTVPQPTGTFTQVSVGARHACAIAPDGTIACWGVNDNGRASPPPGTFREVSAGYYGTCGVRTTGEVVCWPDNSQTPVFNQPPVADLGGPYTGVEGTPVLFDGSKSADPDGTSLTYTWDFGDGTTTVASTATVAHTYTDNSPNDNAYTVTLTVADGGGLTATSKTTATITNVAPTASFVAPTVVPEGTAITLALNNAADAGAADVPGLTYAFDCGDGAGYGEYTQVASAQCKTVDNGVRIVRGSVRDKDGGSSEYRASVTIDNVPPIVTAGNATSVNSGAVYTFSGSFSDPGSADGLWSYVIDWGDGSARTTGTTPSPGSVTGDHRYYTAGNVYPVTVTVTDKDGGTGTAATKATVTRLPILIDVKPFNAANTISLSKDKSVPVAILSSQGFDATKVNLATLTLGDGIAPETSSIQGSSIADANGDGLLDLIVSFSTSQLQSTGDLTTSTTTLVLVGTHQNGVQFRGADNVAVAK